MLTRFVRIQLAIFTIAGIIGVIVMALVYMQAPTLLGFGRMTVTLELPAAGGLYQFSNVSYRGVEVGKVTAVTLTSAGAKATLSLGSSQKIPADLQAEVRSISAVGEQYVDLRPRTDAPPYLHNGSVIAMRDASIPQPVGPLLDKTSTLVNSIPKGKLSDLLDEAFKGFNGAGYDFASLFDSTARLFGDLNGVADRARTLTEDSGPLLDSQAQTTDAIRLWARSLAGFSGQLAINDPQVRSLLDTGPGALNEASALLEQVKPTLPVLLANLTTVGEIFVAYHASVEQVLVLLPPFISVVQQSAPSKNPYGLARGDFSLFGTSDPPACTVGFLPPSEWRDPADTTTIDTPDNLYCKLPQDSPLSVRGARNYPCMRHPGKRAPTIEICNSDKPYEPVAMRQRIFGAYPLDPNLVAQGIAPDDRAGFFRDRIFGPVEGTPLPPGLPVPPESPPPPGSPGLPASPGLPPQPGFSASAQSSAPPPPAYVPESLLPGLPNLTPWSVPDGGATPPAGPGGGGPQAAPSSFGGKGSRLGPSVAIVPYDPRTGRYVAPDGQLYRQSNLVKGSALKTWKDLLPT
jgi:virulence factor Mce-like protein